LAVTALLFSSCASDEDTEPHVPAETGATQPEAGGALLSEEDACERLRSAALDAYDRLGCEVPTYPACPGFLRPGGGSGCYEYSEDSVEACEQAYEAAPSCRSLSPCFATAVQNLELDTCEQLTAPGIGGAASAGGASAGGSASVTGGTDAGGAAPAIGGAPSNGGAPSQAGSPASGAPAAGAGN
jgi:hypothetical protein